jgi:hypothetical protein
MEEGYNNPLVITLSRTVTEYFVANVLHKQSGLIVMVNSALSKQGRTDSIAFYALWIELMVSDEKCKQKHGQWLQPTMLLPAQVGAYLREHQVPVEHKAIIENFASSLDAWAKATAQRLVAPRDSEPHEIEDTENVAANDNQGNKGTVVALATEIPEGYTINAASDILRDAAARNLHKCLDAGLVNNPNGWQAILTILGIVEFTDRSQLAALNNYIKNRIGNKAS